MEPAHLAERLHGFGTTIFAEMTALANETGAINLGQGFPDTDPPPEVADAAVAAIRDGHNQYPPGPGILPLREAIADHQERFYDLRVDPGTDVLVTTGATEAIAAAMISLLDPGDEVMVEDPGYPGIRASLLGHGALARPVEMDGDGLRIDTAAAQWPHARCRPPVPAAAGRRPDGKAGHPGRDI